MIFSSCFGSKHQIFRKVIHFSSTTITNISQEIGGSPNLAGQLKEKRNFAAQFREEYNKQQLKETIDNLSSACQKGIQVNSRTYASLLHSCMKLKSLRDGKQVHAHIIRNGFHHHIFLCNNLISMYAKCWSLMDAYQVFLSMPKRDVVLWNAIIAGFAQCGQGDKALKLFWKMQFYDVKPNKVSFVSVLNACESPTALSEGILIHAYFVDSGLEFDAIVGSAIGNMYRKCGRLQNLCEVFNKMSKQNVVSWNVIIAGYVQIGHTEEALRIFWTMQEDNVKPNNVTLISVLNACASLASLAQGKLVHAYICDHTIDLDIIIGSALANMYCKCASLENAYKILSRLPARDVVLWTTLIAGYIQQGYGKEALEFYSQMQRDGVKPNKVTFINVLGAFTRIENIAEGKLVHAQIIQSGLESDVIVGTSIVHMYGKCGNVEAAFSTFNMMPRKDIVTWNALIVHCADKGYSKEAFRLFQQMQWNSLKPNRATFLGAFNACGNMAALGMGKLVHAEIIDNGMDLDLVLGNAGVDMYAKCGSIEGAHQVFLKMSEHNVVSWTVMIAGYSQHGYAKQALEAYEQMQQEGIEPDQFTLSSVLSACASLAALSYGKAVHAHIVKAGFESDISVANALIDMYAKCEMLEDAYLVFSRMPKRDVVSWNAIIAGYAQHGYGKESLELYIDMQYKGMKPNQFTFSSVLSACAGMVALDQGKQVHADILDSGFESNVFIGAALVDMYAKCGSIEDAFLVFSRTHTRNVVSWTAIISACAQHGQSRRALELFRQMQREGICPDEFTISSILAAYSHAGRIEEGCWFFISMLKDYDITPTEMYYTGMVDLLSRAGYLNEAATFMNKMPFQSNLEMWMSILAASRTLGRRELAEYTAEHILELDSENAAAYLLLASIRVAQRQGEMRLD